MDVARRDVGQRGVQRVEVVSLPAQVDAHVAHPGAGVQRID